MTENSKNREKRMAEYEAANIREWYWFTGLPKIGRRKQELLLKAFKNVTELYNIAENTGEDAAEKLIIKAFSASNTAGNTTGSGAGCDETVKVLLDRELKKKLNAEYDRILCSDVKMVSIDSVNYPDRLKDIFDAPYILYYRGCLPDEEKKTAALVGSRACSEYGRSMAKDIASGLAANDVQIVSGFARGIDTAAHNGCLGAAGGKTFAVFGSGINYCYPPENRFTYDEIIEKGGGIVSEYPPDTKPVPGFFPMRNRIISGLSDIVIVVEAGSKSGALITADHAIEQGRTVMALPGRATDRLSVGCNALIRQGAGIITGMDDIYFELGIPELKNDKKVPKSEKNQNELAKPEKMLYSQLDFNPQGIDDLIRKSRLAPDEVSACLVRMELAGLVKRIGGMYVRGK